MRWKALTFRNLLDTLNIYFRPLEKIYGSLKSKLLSFLAKVMPKSRLNFWIFSRGFQKIQIFLLFQTFKRSVCCLTTRVGALESPDLQVPSGYLEHILSTSRKILRVAKVKVFSKSSTKVKTQPLNFQLNFSKNSNFFTFSDF